MNVYHKNYHPEFIKELPVNFEKFKNTDLSTIPSQYHCLFTTDWNWGRYSTMPMSQRITMHTLYLEYQHNDTKARLEINQEIKEEQIFGFPKD